ncbi:MAG: UDP-galactopyranose mutase [Wujia sp.]
MKKVFVVGAGIVGCTIARELAEKGYQVTILERRSHTAGNLYDYVDEHGILVHKYGPHIFHTSKEEVYKHVCKFSDWKPFKLVCGAVIDDVCTPTAFNLKTVEQFFDEEKATKIKNSFKELFGERKSATVVELLDCPNEDIREYAQFLFDKDYSLYTAKQWGMDPSEVDKSVLARVPIRLTYDEEYFTDTYECMPTEGYTRFIENMTRHENIELALGVEFLDKAEFVGDKILYDGEEAIVIYTGPVDELFKEKHGRLPYRSLRFEWKHEDIDSFQEMPVVAYPQAPGYTRITEYKKLPVQDVDGTTYAVEYPFKYQPEEGAEPYYPVLTEESAKIYDQYMQEAAKISNLYLAGRLADFKYYNMDQAIERALEVAKEF